MKNKKSSAISGISIGFLRRGYSAAGGAEAYLFRLAKALYEQGHRVVLLGTGDWPQEKWPDGEVVVLPKKSLRAFGEAALCYKEEKKIDLLFSMERVPGVDIFRAGDGVHAAWLQHKNSQNRGQATKNEKITKNLIFEKLSFFVFCSLTPIFRWCSWFSFSTFRHRQVLALERELFNSRSTAQVIANSAMVVREIERFFYFPTSQITIIANGVPSTNIPSVAERNEARKKLGIADNECVALFVGSGWKRKGLRVAIKALELANKGLPERSLKLLVAGKGNPKKYSSSNVVFLGPVRDIASLYAVADLFILPTIYDPFSNASLEALVAGLPVITSAMNGCSEILTEGCHGSVIQDPSNVDAFASALKNWHARLQEKETAAEIHRTCAQRGAEFSVERNCEATLRLIYEVLNKNRDEKQRVNRDKWDERDGRQIMKN